MFFLFFLKWFYIEYIGVPHETYETFWHCPSEIHIVKQLLIDFHVYKMVWSRWDSALPWQMIEAALLKNKQKKAVTAVSFALWNKLRLSSVCWFPPLDWQTELPTCQICYEANQADSFFQPSFQWAAISMESSCSPSFTCSFEFTLVPYDIMAARGSDGDIWSNDWGASERWGHDWRPQVASDFAALIWICFIFDTPKKMALQGKTPDTMCTSMNLSWETNPAASNDHGSRWTPSLLSWL